MIKIVNRHNRQRLAKNKIKRRWVFEEEVHGRRLSNIINEQHENVKYLPGIQLPDNVVACIDLEATVRDADAVLLVLPHQFIRTTCQSLIGKLKESVVFCSAVKGFYSCDKTELKLITQVIRETLKCEVGVLMGANIAGVGVIKCNFRITDWSTKEEVNL